MALEQIGYNAPDGLVVLGHHVEIINAGTTKTLVAADSSAMCIFDTAAGSEFILPTPVIGMFFDFRFGIKTSGEYKLVTGTIATEFLKGAIAGFTTTATLVDAFVANGSTAVSVSMNGTTTGGDAGGWMHVVASSSTIWQLTGDLYCGTATPATPIDTT